MSRTGWGHCRPQLSTATLCIATFDTVCAALGPVMQLLCLSTSSPVTPGHMDTAACQLRLRRHTERRPGEMWRPLATDWGPLSAPTLGSRHFMELCWEARCCVTSYLPHKHAFVSSVDMYLHIYNGFPYRQKCWEIDNMYRYVFWLHKDVRQYIIAALVEFHFNVFLQVLVDIHIYVTEL